MKKRLYRTEFLSHLLPQLQTKVLETRKVCFPYSSDGPQLLPFFHYLQSRPSIIGLFAQGLYQEAEKSFPSKRLTGIGFSLGEFCSSDKQWYEFYRSDRYESDAHPRSGDLCFSGLLKLTSSQVNAQATISSPEEFMLHAPAGALLLCEDDVFQGVKTFSIETPDSSRELFFFFQGFHVKRHSDEI